MSQKTKMPAQSQRKKESLCVEKPVPEVQADHELFLQAFESE